jgi:hypothetical protein
MCAIVGAVLCVAAARTADGFVLALDLGRLARRPAPAATLVFGLAGMLFALHGRPGRPRGPSRSGAAGAGGGRAGSGGPAERENGLNRTPSTRHGEGSTDRW